ncbi:tRNA (guanosine(46)-N7)-methyltransferase TrmB [Salaquimonas pukyongi]|uniref:tRNA (guanosine(46)-N7)-methyltransferase TrmB n=1 Tax=Salaquimonas pukyongi TaxID=2712698 RepID=UPI00096B6DEA|nr:tRNA (guanosine(46)-N7)-methyltransferase TrmB [Salaquimonas pukyongi]
MKRQTKHTGSSAGQSKRKAGNFFGRRKAKPLKGAQEEALRTHLPKLAINLAEPCPAQAEALFSANESTPQAIVLEIGFGGGEHLVHRARLHPELAFIGCEPFINGMAKAVRAIADNGLANVRLYGEDATGLLDWLPDGSLSRIDLLYPDPWPKKRHWKRRFVNPGNLHRFHRLLKPGGEFRFASDIESYVNWTLRHVFNHGGFEWTALHPDDWHKPWDEWVSTRYEQKAIREGRTPAYFIFRRR